VIEQSPYTDRLQRLFALEFFGMKLGLENIRALLHALGDPQEQYPTIHIAGTNGKGSVAATLAAIYQSEGRRTGLYTSPHLVDFRERIKIDGAMIDEGSITRFLERVWPIVEERNMTFFEVTTALAFEYFREQRVEIAIIETGLGGRLDATNVLTHPLATVITSIGMDHMQQLGDSLESIAREKAGIFKAGVPAIVNCQPELRHIFEEAAERVGAGLHFTRDAQLDREYAPIRPSLAGPHQMENLRTALVTLQALQERPGLEAVRTGVARTKELIGLHARLEEVPSPDLDEVGVHLILDAAHNPAALARVAENFLGIGSRPVVVLGLMKDKDIESCLEEVARFAHSIVAVAAATDRALPADKLAEAAIAHGLTVEVAASPAAGVARAVRLCEEGPSSAGAPDTVLLTGSHYIIGEFLQNFQKTERVTDQASRRPLSHP
jgi:dihydrofolate synthase/folylpolyglutamate synthase